MSTVVCVTVCLYDTEQTGHADSLNTGVMSQVEVLPILLYTVVNFIWLRVYTLTSDHIDRTG